MCPHLSVVALHVSPLLQGPSRQSGRHVECCWPGERESRLSHWQFTLPRGTSSSISLAKVIYTAMPKFMVRCIILSWGGHDSEVPWIWENNKEVYCRTRSSKAHKSSDPCVGPVPPTHTFSSPQCALLWDHLNPFVLALIGHSHLVLLHQLSLILNLRK